MSRPPITPAYRFAMAVCSPAVRWWGRLEVEAVELLPLEGPLLVVGNHDSYWDPVTVGIAGLPRRQIRALSKASLWKPGLGRILDGMGQIPVQRGSGDLAAMDRAIAELRAGACIGVFPEGTRSLGRELRARSGLGRLSEAVPEAPVVCVAVTDTVGIPRFPSHRPHVRVQFFLPEQGTHVAGEDAAQQSARLLAEIRRRAPIVRAGRRPEPGPGA